MKFHDKEGFVHPWEAVIKGGLRDSRAFCVGGSGWHLVYSFLMAATLTLYEYPALGQLGDCVCVIKPVP